MTLLLYLFIMGPIFIGLLQYITNKPFFKWVAMTMQLCFIFIIIALLKVPNLEFMLLDTPPPYGMMLRLDGIAKIFLLLNNFLFFSLTLFSSKKKYMDRLFTFLFLSLQGLINGLFLSTDIFNVYILIEVATVTVSILIMYKKDKQSMYDGMLYLTVNMIAMTFFLFGIGILYKTVGVLDFDGIKERIAQLENTKSLNLSFAFMFTGVSLKAAVLPLFSWLPKAHGTASAPSIVSAILSGIFVKIGIYLLLRIQFIYSSAIDINDLLLAIGYLTAIAGFIFAIAQTDIKLILAYHTISQVGLILIGFGGNAINQMGGLYHIMGHGVFKALFFIIAGVLIYRFETRKIGDMRGLWWISKPLSIFLLVAILSITGAPFFSGGFSKYFIAYGRYNWTERFLLQLINWGTMVSFIKFMLLIFRKPDRVVNFFKIRKTEWSAITILALTCLLLGTGGTFVNTQLLNQELMLSFWAQLSKIPSYLLNYAICFFIYFTFIKNSTTLKKLRKVELSFNSINIAIVSFFIFTIAYLNMQ
ncbi:complex I subunit 5 family protein [Fusibacter bizertensis]